MLQTPAFPINVSEAALQQPGLQNNQISHHWIFSCEDM